jgi:hypothetical protein
MEKTLALMLLGAGAACSVAHGQYVMELRLIADGQAGSPGGPSPAYTFPVVMYEPLPPRVGFWLQARVSQTSGQNWGVTRVSSPQGGGASQISVSDPAGACSISRGVVNSGGTLFGRGVGYRNGGLNTGNTGNAAGSSPFPGSANNENGGLDNGGSGALMTRLYGFDCYVGGTRADTDADGDGDVDDNGDGLPENPWGVNGASHNAGVDGAPFPSDGSFSPWANVYRFYLEVGSPDVLREIVVSASALVNGAIQASATSLGGSTYAMQLSAGQVIQAPAWTYFPPAPGAAGALGLGAACLLRRKR